LEETVREEGGEQIGGWDALQILSEDACKFLKRRDLHQPFLFSFNKDFREKVIEREKRK